MKFLRLGSWILGMTLALLPLGSSAAPRCQDLFLKPLVLENEKHAPVLTDWGRSSLSKTVEFQGPARPGNHGGRRLELVSPRKQWLSQHSTLRFDVQGDPRWFIAAYGPDIARFFGFEILDPKTMLVPDTVEFQGAVDKINAVLKAQNKEPIPLRIVGDAGGGSPLQAYLNHFLNGELNFATSGHHLVHDLSFHTGSIFNPPRLTHLARRRTKFVLDFMNYVFERNPLFDSEHHRQFSGFIKTFLVVSIDNGTALNSLVQIARQTKDPTVRAKIASLLATKHNIDQPAEEINYATASYLAVGFLDEVIRYRNTQLLISYPETTDLSLSLPDYTLHLLSTVMTHSLQIEKTKSDVRSFLRQLMTEFVKTRPQEDVSLDLIASITTPDFDLTRPWVSREDATQVLNDESEKRIHEIKKVVEQLTSPSSVLSK